MYGITVGGGFVALTGEVGTGKTTLCHCLLQELPENIDIALILNPKMNAAELLATICDELAIPYDKQQPSLKNLIDALNHYLLQAHANGRKTVLLIDEAQNLSLEVLEQIRLLTNLETSKNKLLQIILVGQPELKKMLGRRELRQLNQRITARYHLLPLTLDETRAYIRHRLERCNGNQDLFKEHLIRLIYRLSSGVPRLINILCDRTLLGAYANGQHHITARLVRKAAKEIMAPAKTHRSPWPILLTLLILSLLAFATYHFNVGNNQHPQPQHAEPPKPKTVAAAPTKSVETPKFADWLNNPELTLNAAIGEGLKRLGQAATDAELRCEKLTSLDVHCLSGSANWKDLMAINRPVILEFSLPSENTRYVLLSRLEQGQPILSFGKDYNFPLSEVLVLWDGNYLLLWKAPIQSMKSMFPGQTSDSILWLRQQLQLFDGESPKVAQPRYFDYTLQKRLKRFQHQRRLVADGIAGVQTQFYLDNLTTAETAPRLITPD